MNRVGVLANSEMLSDPIYFEGRGAGFTQIKAGDTVDAESVAATRPDLILAYSAEEAQLLGSIAPVYLPEDAATVEDLYPVAAPTCDYSRQNAAGRNGD
ncbi:MAG: hypothetical protein HC828_15425 [Blastochloris sp.]|nr:hypothetical protein [Blastochloris sp.]